MNMDRHICRAKAKDTNEWIYGYYVKHNTVMTCFATDDPKPKHYIMSDGSTCDWGFEPPLQMTEIDPDTLCYCIGTTDKNMRPIFEGDIVKGKVHLHGGYRVRKGVIRYICEAFKLKVGYDDKEIPSPCEVVGNIYDDGDPECIG